MNNFSQMRVWAENNITDLSNFEDRWTPKNLFIVTMYFLSTFAKEPPEEYKIPEDEKPWEDVHKKFFNDAILFEVGCYMIFRIDHWLLNNNYQQREDIFNIMAQKFLDLFGQILNSSELYSIFNQRLNMYGQLANEATDAEKFHHHLTQLILQAELDNLPSEDYNLSSSPVMITDITDTLSIKMEIKGWEFAFLPKAMGFIEEYCKNDEELLFFRVKSSKDHNDKAD